MTAQIIAFPGVPHETSRQALDYYMRAETPLAEDVRYALVNMIGAARRGRARPPMPTTERAVRLWPLLPE